MRVLDLFSGIGGFSLGLERAGMQTAAFCESNPFCRAVLGKHWPNVPIYSDVREVTGARLAADGIAIDVICGGFPCQPFSSASHGRRSGRDDARYLWPEMRRIISELKPTWVIGENVTHFDGVALEEMVLDLESLAYEVGPTLEIPACAVGRDHRRARLWVLGYSDRNRKPDRALHAEVAGLPRGRSDARNSRAKNGIPRRLDGVRRAAIGNSADSGITEQLGRAIMAAETVK